MRKLWCAGAIACGFLLLGAVPAQAEPLPNPAETPRNALGSVLEPTSGWRVASPLASDPLSGQPLVTLQPGGDRKLLQLEPGADSDLTGALAERPARQIEKPTDRRPLAPAADVLSGTRPNSATPDGAHGGRDLAIADSPVDDLFGTLPMLAGLTPAGMSALPGDERPAVERAERRTGDFPLLGGLDGTTSAVDDLQRRFVDVRSDVTGLPVGGSPVRRSAKAAPPVTARKAGPSASAPATAPSAAPSSVPDIAPTDVAPVDPAGSAAPTTPAPSPSTQRATASLPATEAEDPRLYEEPVDGFVAK